MRVLGIDYGLKRIGLAIGESEVGMAFARDGMLSMGSPEADALNLFSYYQTEGCELIVLGLPLLESGEEGEQARITKQLGENLLSHGAALEYWDERYSTGAANRNLSYLDSRRRKEAADSEAARIMLAEYLASHHA